MQAKAIGPILEPDAVTKQTILPLYLPLADLFGRWMGKGSKNLTKVRDSTLHDLCTQSSVGIRKCYFYGAWSFCLFVYLFLKCFFKKLIDLFVNVFCLFVCLFVFVKDNVIEPIKKKNKLAWIFFL